MSERKEGWYWIKIDNGVSGDLWLPSKWDPGYEFGATWFACGYAVEQSDIVEVGQRIPTPDEDWQCVPKRLDIAMIEEFEDRLTEQGWGNDAAGEIDKQDLWDAQLDAAPKPEDV